MSCLSALGSNMSLSLGFKHVSQPWVLNVTQPWVLNVTQPWVLTCLSALGFKCHSALGSNMFLSLGFYSREGNLDGELNLLHGP